MAKHFKSVLIHTCTIQRATLSRSGSGESIETFADSSTSNRCRLVRQLERFAAENISRERQYTDLLLLQVGADIQEGDRVTNFCYYDTGAATGEGTYTVTAVKTRNAKTAHHISVELEKVE